MLFVDIVDVIGGSAWGVQLFKSGCLGQQHIFTYSRLPKSPIHILELAYITRSPCWYRCWSVIEGSAWGTPTVQIGTPGATTHIVCLCPTVWANFQSDSCRENMNSIRALKCSISGEKSICDCTNQVAWSSTTYCLPRTNSLSKLPKSKRQSYLSTFHKSRMQGVLFHISDALKPWADLTSAPGHYQLLDSALKAWQEKKVSRRFYLLHLTVAPHRM